MSFSKNIPVKRVLTPYWKSILRYILADTKNEACVSHFKNNSKVKQKLEELDWKSHMEKLEKVGEDLDESQDVIEIDDSEPTNANQGNIPEELRKNNYDGDMSRLTFIDVQILYS